MTELAGKKADYAVTLNEIKQKVLPAMDDAFAAKLMPEKTLADLRHTIEHNLEHEKEHEIERAKEQQIVKFLHEHITFDLPPSLLKNETRRALNELVHRNRERGVTDEMLKGKEKELIEGAGSLAAHRLKTNFILHRIAEQEKIEVTREEVDERIREQAAHYNVSVEKMRKELEEKDRINGLAEEILLGKTLDFLKPNVSVETTLGTVSCARGNGIKHDRCQQKFLSIRPHPDGGRTDRPRRAELRYLFAPAEGPDHFPRDADRRSHRQSGHRAVAFPADGGRQEGHQHLHQLAGRLGHGGTGDLRHDAVPDLRRDHLLPRDGGEHGRGAALRGDERQAVRAAEFRHHDPPGLRRRPGPGERRRAAGGIHV